MQIVVASYEKILEKLNEWKIVSNMQLSEDDLEWISDLHLLTNKKFVYACNVSEDMMDTPESELQKILWLDENQTVIAICAKLESDMVEMEEEEKNEFLEEMWLKTTWLDDLIKASYDALGLMYYFTAWVQEVRAWTIHQWDTAPKAAGVIHTDFEKGFIKADKVNWKDLVENGGWSGAREAGKVSLEWKEYIVADWDVLLFKFAN
jgi:ribosome-binding ATPase YchF (GTP1/OBG family)